MSHVPFVLFIRHSPQHLPILYSLAYVPSLVLLPQRKIPFLFFPIYQNESGLLIPLRCESSREPSPTSLQVHLISDLLNPLFFSLYSASA